MTSENRRLQAAALLRQAVIAEAYEETQAAIMAYRREVDLALAACAPGGPPPMELVREAMDLIAWALRAARAARARTSANLDHVSAVLRYRAPAPSPLTWKLEG